jgi:hypothetical protein
MGMLFQPNVTPQTLSNLGNVPLGMTLEAQNGVAQAQQADNQQYQDLPGMIAHEQAMRPLREQQAQIGNDTSLAQLPGIRAQAETQQRNNREGGLLSDAHVKDLLSKYSADDLQRQADGGLAHGQMAMQAAAAINANPVGGIPAAREMMQSSGLWDPSWDTMNPQQLSKKLQQYGEAVATSSQKVQLAIRQNEARLQREAQMEEIKQRGRMQLSNDRLGTARQMKMAELDTKMKLDKPTYQGLSSRYTELARQAYEDGDQEQGRKFDAEAQRLNQAAMALPAVGPNTANQGKVDPTALTNGAIPTINPGRAVNSSAGGMPLRGEQSNQPKADPLGIR